MRKIIHVDMDCFFAAVEMRDNPALVSLPLAIGSPAERRGVIATCNYVARRYGIRSAMATASSGLRMDQPKRRTVYWRAAARCCLRASAQ